MNHLERLIAELCPDGVEFVPLKSLLSYEQPTKYIVSSTRYDDAHATPVLTAGQTFVLGFTDDTDGIYEAGPANSVIIIDDFTTAFKWVDFPFKVKSSALKILTNRSDELSLLRYVYYAMQCIRYAPQDHARQWISIYSNFTIPLPQMEVQREIVRILDNFSQLEAELEAELEARRKQYEFYRNQLLNNNVETVRRVKLGELGRIVTGRTPKASDLDAWGHNTPFITPSDISNGLKYIELTSRRLSKTGVEALNNCLIPANSILVTCIGADMGKTVINRDICVTNQQINSLIIESKAHSHYLFHVLTSMRASLLQQGNRAGGTMPIINKSDFAKIEIPLPPLEEQERIVEILDKFDALVNDLSIGLPAELQARRKQYEYYRDQLLTFDELSA